MNPTAPSDVPADVQLDVQRVHTLIATQHPDLLGDVVPFSQGWDNEVYQVGERWLARMPRRALGAHNVRREQRWLPELPDLGVPIPLPERVGVPSGDYPYPWSIVPLLRGRTVGLDALEPAGLLAVLERLHHPCPAGVPADAARSMPLNERTRTVERGLHHLPATLAGRMRAIWSRAGAAPKHEGPPCWVHGDLHPFNLLHDAGRLAAVLDWGDLFGGDPAPDLAALWMLFEPVEHTAFIDAFGEPRYLRGAGWAVYFAVALLDAAARGASPAFRHVAIRAIERLDSTRFPG